ncbi:MAG: TatD family hydrolase [Alphaproteobacteria bacterium]|nr:TatD family hydrolase [Alphaproteobacteria bacterium]
MKIIDAHSHIDYISHIKQPDVVGTVVCTTNESEWVRVENITVDDICVYGAFGVHPWFAGSVDFGFESRLKDLLQNNSDYMLGEIGLDKNKPNMEK